MKRTLLQPAEILQSLLLCRETEKQNNSQNRRSRREVDEIQDLDELLRDFEAEGDETKPPKPVKQEKAVKQYVEMLKKHPRLDSFCLSDDDVMVIAYLWRQIVRNGSHSMEWQELLTWCKLDKIRVMDCINFIVTLLDRDIITLLRSEASDYHINPYSILRGDFTMHSMIRFELTGASIAEKLDKILAAQWKDTEQLNRDLFTAQKIIEHTCIELQESRDEPIRYHYRALRTYLTPVFSRLRSANPELPFIKLLNKTQLSDIDTVLLIWTYANHLCDQQCDIDHLLNLISIDFPDRLAKMDYLQTTSKLLSIGCELKQESSYRRNSLYLGFSAKTKEELEIKDSKAGDDSSDNGNESTYLLNELNVHQSFEDLILPREDKAMLTAAIQRFVNNANTDLSQWGICKPTTTKNDVPVKGTTILLYGCPGTGKTFSAGAIASALDKKLVAIDASKLRDKYYGESEKVIRRLFVQMRKVMAKTDNPPVFLLNEADQIIHTRATQSYNTSHVENAIQNIFLEELETFPGILILTTNLVENIDEAYFRRFNIKIELHRPDADCRLQLWKLHLPHSIPGAAEIDIHHLAQTYNFTGGQISLIVQNACNEAIARSGLERKITIADLMKYAKLEDPWCRSGEGQKKIGF